MDIKLTQNWWRAHTIFIAHRPSIFPTTKGNIMWNWDIFSASSSRSKLMGLNNQMAKQKASTIIIGLLMLLIVISLVLCATATAATTIECSTVTSLVSTCSTFITYGSPDPLPGTPCCDAMVSLNAIGDQRFVCRCMMGLITTYTSNATAIATLPGFCGVSLGFAIDPNTDCSL